MQQRILFFLFFTSVFVLSAQEVVRVEINGRINVDSKEKEGITIYNQNSNQGVTTDENGAFKIKVAENDVIAFGALQFKDFSIVIDKRIIESRQVSVRLVEDVNKLDEVIVLPYDLSGNLSVDVEAVRTYNVNMSDVFKGEEDFDDYNFAADNKSKIDDPLLDENRLRNGLNLVNIFKLFVKDKDFPKSKTEELQERISPIAKRYNATFLKDNFNIPTDLTEAFIDFVEDKGYEKDLLDRKNEIYLIQFLKKQSQSFLQIKN